MSEGLDEMDYERDVLKVKELSQEIKQIGNKGSNRVCSKTSKDKPTKSQNKPATSKPPKYSKDPKKTTVFSNMTVQRNPR